jgi:hypothetical protein
MHQQTAWLRRSSAPSVTNGRADAQIKVMGGWPRHRLLPRVIRGSGPLLPRVEFCIHGAALLVDRRQKTWQGT